MEQFKKWTGPAFYYGKDPLNRPILKAKRKAWRAALEWVIGRVETSNSDGSIIQDIKDELRN